jgi:transcriptional regulator with XRE-family HTH domain
MLSDEIRQAVERSGLSQAEIARQIGVSRAMICRFLAGDRGLSMDALDRLGRLLNLHIQVGKPRRRKSR